jgi:hypothetical protein
MIAPMTITLPPEAVVASVSVPDRVRIVKPTADGMDLDVSGSSMLMP